MKQFIFKSNIELRETQTAALSDTHRQANWEEMASHLSLWDLKRIKQFGFGRRIKPDKQFVLDAFEQHVQQTPESIAIIDGEKRLSYRELNLKATQIAEELVHVGVRQGDYIGLFVSRSESLIVAIIASLKIGAIYIPQDAKKTPANALKSIVELVKPAAILTTETCCGLLPDFNQTNTFTIENLLQRNTAFNQQATVSVSPTKYSDDTCFVLFTSGTTGTPNGVCVSHKNLSNIIMTQPGDLGIKPGMVVSQLLSISFDMSAWEIFGALCHGATLILRGSDFQATASRANVIIATPSILARINPSLCPELETVAVAGEPCPIPLAEKWSGFCQFYNCCGPTETTIVNTMQKYHRASR
ncbi:AMP-binding protein [Veronia nyctiphanis]|nr:AMP-binding protein [Veronia nyctiphanis]